MTEAKAKPKRNRLNSMQIDLLIEALVVVLMPADKLDETFGAEAIQERAEAYEYLQEWLRDRVKQLSFRT